MNDECVKLSAINLVSFQEEQISSNRRKPGRIRCEHLGCSCGSVVDLSVTGARLIVKGFFKPRPGKRRRLVFRSMMGPSLPFLARVMWSKRLGLFSHEVGVEFVDLDETKHAQLVEMSRAHANRTMINPSAAA